MLLMGSSMAPSDASEEWAGVATEERDELKPGLLALMVEDRCGPEARMLSSFCCCC